MTTQQNVGNVMAEIGPLAGLHAVRAYPGGNLGTLETWEKGPELLLESIVILTVGPIPVNPLRCRRLPLPAHASAGVTW